MPAYLFAFYHFSIHPWNLFVSNVFVCVCTLYTNGNRVYLECVTISSFIYLWENGRHVQSINNPLCNDNENEYYFIKMSLCRHVFNIHNISFFFSTPQKFGDQRGETKWKTKRRQKKRSMANSGTTFIFDRTKHFLFYIANRLKIHREMRYIYKDKREEESRNKEPLSSVCTYEKWRKMKSFFFLCCCFSRCSIVCEFKLTRNNTNQSSYTWFLWQPNKTQMRKVHI